MPSDRTVPTQNSTTAGPRSRFSVPRGLIAGTLAVTALVWGQYAIGTASLLSARVQSGIFLGLLLLTICSRRAKVLLVQTMQRVPRDGQPARRAVRTTDSATTLTAESSTGASWPR